MLGIRMIKQFVLMVVVAVMLASCSADGNYTGIEYAPQMYHSVPYEPLSQVVDKETSFLGLVDLGYNNTMPQFKNGELRGDTLSNMLLPVEGTVKRQYYTSESLKDTVMFFDLHPDSLSYAAKNLKNPLPAGDEAVLAKGKALYTSYCAACHGEKGDGKGKVGEVYGGVPNYTAAAYKNMTEGHIFHVITHGKGRMWPHKSQLSAEERWKVVRYVQELQKGK
jgi:cytochrome c553